MYDKYMYDTYMYNMYIGLITDSVILVVRDALAVHLQYLLVSKPNYSVSPKSHWKWG